MLLQRDSTFEKLSRGKMKVTNLFFPNVARDLDSILEIEEYTQIRRNPEGIQSRRSIEQQGDIRSMTIFFSFFFFFPLSSTNKGIKLVNALRVPRTNKWMRKPDRARGLKWLEFPRNMETGYAENHRCYCDFITERV